MDVNAVRGNIIFIPLIVLTARGISIFVNFTSEKLIILFIACYLILFSAFELYYFNDYSTKLVPLFSSNLEEAIDDIKDETDKVYIDCEILYSTVLFYLQYPTDEYLSTVSRHDYGYTVGFGNYIIDTSHFTYYPNSTYLLYESTYNAIYASSPDIIKSTKKYGSYYVIKT